MNLDSIINQTIQDNRQLIVESFQRRVTAIEAQLAQPAGQATLTRPAGQAWLVQCGVLYVAHGPDGIFLTGVENAYCYPTREAALRTARHVRNGNNDRGVAIDRSTALAMELIFAQALLDNLLATTGE